MGQSRTALRLSGLRAENAKSHNPPLWRRAISVGQRLHEADDGVFFGIRQTEIADAGLVHILSRFRRRPAARTLARIARCATRQYVACIVKVHDRLEAREITI